MSASSNLKKKINVWISKSENYSFLSWFFVQNCHSSTNLINILLNRKIFYNVYFHSFVNVSSIHVHADLHFSIYFHFSENLFFNASIPAATARLLVFIFFVTLKYWSNSFRFCEYSSNKVYIWGVSLTCIFMLHFGKKTTQLNQTKENT